MNTENLKMRTNKLTTIPKRMKKVNSIVLATALAICFVFPGTGFSNSPDFLWLGNRQQTKTNAPTQTGEGSTQTPYGLVIASDVLSVIGLIVQSSTGGVQMGPRNAGYDLKFLASIGDQT